MVRSKGKPAGLKVATFPKEKQIDLSDLSRVTDSPEQGFLKGTKNQETQPCYEVGLS